MGGKGASGPQSSNDQIVAMQQQQAAQATQANQNALRASTTASRAFRTSSRARQPDHPRWTSPRSRRPTRPRLGKRARQRRQIAYCWSGRREPRAQSLRTTSSRGHRSRRSPTATRGARCPTTAAARPSTGCTTRPAISSIQVTISDLAAIEGLHRRHAGDFDLAVRRRLLWQVPPSDHGLLHPAGGPAIRRRALVARGVAGARGPTRQLDRDDGHRQALQAGPDQSGQHRVERRHPDGGLAHHRVAGRADRANQLYSTEDPSVAANTAQNMVANASLTKPLLNPAGALFAPLTVGVGNALSGFVNNANYINPAASGAASTSSGASGSGVTVNRCTDLELCATPLDGDHPARRRCRLGWRVDVRRLAGRRRAASDARRPEQGQRRVGRLSDQDPPAAGRQRGLGAPEGDRRAAGHARQGVCACAGSGAEHRSRAPEHPLHQARLGRGKLARSVEPLQPPADRREAPATRTSWTA